MPFGDFEMIPGMNLGQVKKPSEPAGQQQGSDAVRKCEYEKDGLLSQLRADSVSDSLIKAD